MGPEGWYWTHAVLALAAVAALIVLHAALSSAVRGRRGLAGGRIAGALRAAIAGGDPRPAAAAVAASPAAGAEVLVRHAWLLRGAWLDRLAAVVADPAATVALRRLSRRPGRVSGGHALLILGLAGDPADRAWIEGLSRRPGPVGDAAAAGLVRAGPVGDPAVRAAMVRLESVRPDLLRALLPQVPPADLARWIAGVEPTGPELPAALFAAGRLGLACAPAAVLAGLAHPRPQVRRAAAIAAGPGQAGCRERLCTMVEEDPDPRVRVAALAALGRMPDPANIGALARVLAVGPWLVQAHAVPAILAQGEPGARLLAGVRTGAWRSGAVRWVRERAAPGEGR